MKHTIQALDNAIDFLLPNIKRAKSEGIDFSRPVLIKMVAHKFFVSDTSKKYSKRNGRVWHLQGGND